jgi:hypothetical protein
MRYSTKRTRQAFERAREFHASRRAWIFNEFINRGADSSPQPRLTAVIKPIQRRPLEGDITPWR